jgi:hypothetical protein
VVLQDEIGRARAERLDCMMMIQLVADEDERHLGALLARQRKRPEAVAPGAVAIRQDEVELRLRDMLRKFTFVAHAHDLRGEPAGAELLLHQLGIHIMFFEVKDSQRGHLLQKECFHARAGGTAKAGAGKLQQIIAPFVRVQVVLSRCVSCSNPASAYGSSVTAGVAWRSASPDLSSRTFCGEKKR